MKFASHSVSKLKKYANKWSQIGLILTFILTVSCNEQKHYISAIKGVEIPITDTLKSDLTIEKYINPYREHIDKDLSTVLAFAPETLDKSGVWQTTVGNLMADATLDHANRIFKARTSKNVDLVLLNLGGIRSILPKGDVTTRTAFELMPFENKVIVAELPGSAILEMIAYIISEKKAHPLAGMTFTIDKSNKPQEILIGGKPFELSRNYYVATSDYLITGGDRMYFFKKSINNLDIDYKLRNIMIDYFKEQDTIPVLTDIRIKQQ